MSELIHHLKLVSLLLQYPDPELVAEVGELDHEPAIGGGQLVEEPDPGVAKRREATQRLVQVRPDAVPIGVQRCEGHVARHLVLVAWVLVLAARTPAARAASVTWWAVRASPVRMAWWSG